MATGLDVVYASGLDLQIIMMSDRLNIKQTREKMVVKYYKPIAFCWHEDAPIIYNFIQAGSIGSAFDKLMRHRDERFENTRLYVDDYWLGLEKVKWKEYTIAYCPPLISKEKAWMGIFEECNEIRKNPDNTMTFQDIMKKLFDDFENALKMTQEKP